MDRYCSRLTIASWITLGISCDNGAPFFTAFKFQPGEPVELTIGAEDGVKNVEYTYNLCDNIPRIHAPQMTPFEAVPVVKVGGLTITK